MNVINKYGYNILQKLNKSDIINIKKNLTICKENPYTKKIINTFILFKKVKNIIVVPIQYGLKYYGDAENKLPLNIASFNFTGELKDYQIDIVKKCMDGLRKNYSGILTLPCGYGKTICSLNIACQLKLKTLVIVNKLFLKDQWINSINKFTTAKCDSDINNDDIVVLLIQSIYNNKYDKSFFRKFSFVIYDEAHHTGASIYSKALKYAVSYYSIGLSATPERDDGLMKITNYFLGNILYKIERNVNSKINVFKVHFDNSFNVPYSNNTTGLEIYNLLLTNICNDERRNNKILKIVKLLKSFDRKILILSIRIEHLKILNKLIEDSFLYIGNIKKKKRIYIEENANIILSTYQLSSEGLDIPRLDTIILSTPYKKVKQSIGRVTRNIDDNPIVIDIIDNHNIFKKHFKLRSEEYRLSEYTINKISYLKQFLKLKNNN